MNIVHQESTSKPTVKKQIRLVDFFCATTLYDDTDLYNTVYNLLHIQVFLIMVGQSKWKTSHHT